MTDITTTSLTAEELTVFQQRLSLANRLKKGATWFYWIAGLSLVNSLITLSGADWNFSIGLSVTQILDSVANILVQDTSGSIVLLVKAIAFVLDLAIVGVFVLFGWFALRQHRWAMIIGMILYSLDGVILHVLGRLDQRRSACVCPI